MLKIATHNSATGEKGGNILSHLVAVFSKCQGKTIAEQYAAGCRYFDIRVKEKNGEWVCAHGLWTAKRKAMDILRQINAFGDCYVMITYEGEFHLFFEGWVKMWRDDFPHIIFTSVNVKKPKWRTLMSFNPISCKSDFKILDGSSWHTYLPIPWLWKKIYHNNPKFNDHHFKMVDFL